MGSCPPHLASANHGRGQPTPRRLAHLARIYAQSDVWLPLVFFAWVLTCNLSRWYAEDLERVPALAELKNLPVLPLELLVRLKYIALCLTDVTQEVAGDTSIYTPSGEVLARWKDATRVPYESFESFWELQEQEILCPKCNVQLFVREFVPGYLAVHG